MEQEMDIWLWGCFTNVWLERWYVQPVNIIKVIVIVSHKSIWILLHSVSITQAWQSAHRYILHWSCSPQRVCLCIWCYIHSCYHAFVQVTFDCCGSSNWVCAGPSPLQLALVVSSCYYCMWLVVPRCRMQPQVLYSHAAKSSCPLTGKSTSIYRMSHRHFMVHQLLLYTYQAPTSQTCTQFLQVKTLHKCCIHTFI